MLEQIPMSSPSDQQPRRSDALRRTTGRDRPEWFAALDAWGAAGRPYRVIADWLKTEHGLSKWWAQKLIVEYEEARGVRAPGVRHDGTFEVGASKTIDANRETILDAFEIPAIRERWLAGVSLDDFDRTPESIRFAWTDGTSRVTVNLSTTSAARTSVVVRHDRLRTASDGAEMKAFWRERLPALKSLLEG
jgi:hypothetical protein